MGAAYYIIAEHKPEEMDLFVNGKALARADQRLASAARKLGVRELLDFFSQDPEEAAEFVEDPEVLKNLPPEEWFAPADGLKTVRALLPEFLTSPEDAAIADDLREFEGVLVRLEEAGLRWHLSVDF
ncbi:MAG TPA: hypothetical protein VNQ90_08015 [Chthoniobacteraceae bacterium]|nr:hypothetical protein [Chthoniobacteraceae bacterium]